MKLVKAMATVGGLTGLSRIAGFLRDILTASIMGAGPIADAFFVALKLPNLFRRVTAEGAFSVSFIPLYTSTLEQEGEVKAAAFANNAFAVMLWTLLVFTVVAVLLMPFIIYFIAPGFTGDVSRYAGAVEMSRITFPYLLLMSLAALMGGVLNAHGRFAPFAAAPILFNMTLVVFLLASGFFKNAGYAMSWGIAVAGVLQCLMLSYFLGKAGLRIRLVPPSFRDPKIRRLFRLMGPGMLGAGVMHINLFADVMIASFLETGSISYLYYADRLNQLPLGMVGIAVGTALLPLLSKESAAGNVKEARNLFNRALEICTLLALPAAVGLFMASFPIITTLFQHGEFGARSAAMTTAVLTAYAVGIPPYIIVKVLSTSYWARQDTVTPVKAAVASTFFNIGAGLFLILYAKAGVLGIATATAMAGWLQMILLAWGLRREESARLDRRCVLALCKIVLSCAVMAACVYIIKGKLLHYYMEHKLMSYEIMGLVWMIGGGATVYGLCILLTGAVKIGDLGRALSRPPPVAKKNKKNKKKKTVKKGPD